MFCKWLTLCLVILFKLLFCLAKHFFLILRYCQIKCSPNLVIETLRMMGFNHKVAKIVIQIIQLLNCFTVTIYNFIKNKMTGYIYQCLIVNNEASVLPHPQFKSSLILGKCISIRFTERHLFNNRHNYHVCLTRSFNFIFSSMLP